MAQRIKIANIEIKEGDNDKGHWENYIITGEDKTKVSTFDHHASGLKVGDTIEAEIELKGKYANIKNFKVLEKATAATVHETETGKLPAKLGVSRDDAIAQQVAVKAVVELVAHGAIPPNHPLFKAVFDWCWDKLLPNSARPLPSEPEKTQPRPVEDKTGKRLRESPDTLPEFKTGSELVNYALKHGWKMLDIKVALRINNPTEIKDIPAASKVLFPD